MPQRSAAVAQCAVVGSPCPSDDEDWAHCPHQTLCLLLHRLWSCCLETGCRVSQSTLLALSTESLLAYATGALTLLTVSIGRVFLWRFVIFSDGQERINISPHQTLWPMCCSLPIFFSWSLYFAANRARLNRQPSLRHSVGMTDRGPPLVFSKQGQNARTRHYLYVDNIGIVSDQFSQVHAVLDESKQDFEKDRLFLHKISVKSVSGWALGFELNAEQLRTQKAPMLLET